MTRSLALVERLPGHTEDMGAFVSLGLELGYDTHLFYENADRFHMIEYFQQRFGIPADRIHDWKTITDCCSDFDLILLNTSFVWLDYMPWLRQLNDASRLIVVHHHPEDVELNPYGESLYLTPAGGNDRWVFPLYAKSESLREFAPQAAPATPHQVPQSLTLTCIGSFEGKDVAGAKEFLRAGGRLVHYDRHPCRYFTGYEGLYLQHIGLSGAQLMVSLDQQKRPIFLWLPIVSPSDYLVCRFTAALLTGVDLNCVMVMPELLREMYGFPKDAVVTYDNQVTESGCIESLRESPAAQDERRRRLCAWAAGRWKANLKVFREVLERAG
jgi:hypothetical protein